MCVCVLCARAGPAVPLHLPVVGVHWHRHHLHHHPPRGHRPAADAHSQVLLLGHQPAGVQWHQPQRPRYVRAPVNHKSWWFCFLYTQKCCQSGCVWMLFIYRLFSTSAWLQGRPRSWGFLFSAKAVASSLFLSGSLILVQVLAKQEGKKKSLRY